MFVDTHCHLDFPEFDRDRTEVISRARAQGVDRIINVGASLMRSKQSVEIAQKHEVVFSSCGVHPDDAESLDEKVFTELENLAKNKKVVAIGETGLDYYRQPEKKEIQIDAFKKQLALAKKLNLPVIIHSRPGLKISHQPFFDSDKDILYILKNLDYKLRGVVHCFCRNRKIAFEYLKLGLFISFTGNITYNIQEEALDAIRAIPKDKILIETDAPFLSPAPHRGKRNEPANVRLVAEKLADIKGLKLAEAEKMTTENAKKLFKI